jgi:nucleoside 2-deoxyribosyltransferase
MKKAYCASPLGFSEAGRVFLYEKLIPAIERSGITVIDPWKLTDESDMLAASSIQNRDERAAAWRRLNMIIGENNAKGIDEADLVIAVLDGSDVDSGTAAEIGYAYAKGKHVCGYRSDFRLSADNEGSTVNLQVEYFIHASGGSIASSLEQLKKMLGALSQ